MPMAPLGRIAATGASANSARQLMRRFVERGGQRRVTVSVITHRLASEHMPVSARSAAGSPQTSERGLAERASHLSYRTRKPRDMT
jgi:hypothetical protein